MARKRNPENDLVVSSSVAAVPVRRKSTAARPKHSPTTAETPVSQVREPQAEAPQAASVVQVEPSREAIAELAYLYWEARGCQGGSAEEDWLRAEQELRNQAATAVS